MDGDDRRTSQYAQSYHPHSASRPATSQPMGPPTTTDRFAQPGTPVRSDSVRHSMTRSYLPGYSQFGYTDQHYGSASIHDGSPMQGVEMQYSPTGAYMQSTRPSVGHTPSQQYAAYQHSPMLSSGAPQAMYDPIQPYQQQQSRQSAAIEVMSSQLGGLPGHFDSQSALQMPATASSYAQQQQQQQQQQQSQHYSTAPRQSLASQQHAPQPQSYASNSGDYAPLHEALASSHPPHQEQQQQHLLSQQQQQQQQQQPPPPRPSSAEAEALNNGFRDFHTSLATALQLVVSTSSASSTASPAAANHNLESASNSLVSATRWLTTHIQPLGLHHDTESADQYSERLQMWTRLNLAWEALAEALRTQVLLFLPSVAGGGGLSATTAATTTPAALTTSTTSTGPAPIAPKMVKTLLDELVKFGDELERFGLVDYELGFAEELIVAGFLGVLDLVEGAEELEEERNVRGGRLSRRGGNGHGPGIDVTIGVGLSVNAAVATAGMARSGV